MRLSARSRMRGAKRKPSKMAQSEDMIGEAGRVRVIFLDLQVRLVIEETIENMRRIPNCRVDDLGMERSVLVGDVGVKSNTGVVPILEIYLSSSFAATSGAEELSIGR